MPVRPTERSDSDLERLLSGGDPRSLEGVEQAIASVWSDRATLGVLFECLFSADEVVRMRASDALEKVARSRSELFADFKQRLLGEVARIEQPSVQWHLAQILAEIDLTVDERERAVAILKQNLERYDDWIVLNLTLQALAQFAQHDPRLRDELIPILHHHQKSSRKSIAKRATRLLDELQRESS